MRHLFNAGVILVALAATAPTAEPPPEGDLGRVQGRWSARTGPRNDIRVEMEVQGRRVKVVITTPQGVTIRARGLLHVDETCQPRALDWVEFKSSDGRTLPDIPAIYRIDEHGWTVCNGGPNGARPVEFRPGEGLLAGVVGFERTGTKVPRSAVPRSDAKATAVVADPRKP
jgi:uncharacterized protein (TIGR03067 family)